MRKWVTSLPISEFLKLCRVSLFTVVKDLVETMGITMHGHHFKLPNKKQVGVRQVRLTAVCVLRSFNVFLPDIRSIRLR